MFCSGVDRSFTVLDSILQILFPLTAPCRAPYHRVGRRSKSEEGRTLSEVTGLRPAVAGLLRKRSRAGDIAGDTPAATGNAWSL